MNQALSRKIAFAVLTVAIAAVVAEAAARLVLLRWGAPVPDNFNYQISVMQQNYEQLPAPLFWRPRPATRMGGRYIVQRDGFHGFALSNELPTGPATSKKRVVCLGDSVTFGVMIDDTAKTWPALLQILLGDEKFEVLNLGRPGYTSFQGRALLAQYSERLRPDVLILAFGWNNCLESPLPDSLRARRATSLSPLIDARRLLERSGVYKVLRAVLFPVPSGSQQRCPLREFKENLIAMATSGAQAIFLTLPQAPCSDEECRKGAHEDAHRQYNQAIRGLGGYGRVLDIDAIFYACGPDCALRGFSVAVRDGRVGGGDPIHPNERGAELFARLLRESLASP